MATPRARSVRTATTGSGAIIPGKKIGKVGDKKAINNRYKWVEYVAQDDDGDDYVIRCLLRTSLTNGEIEALRESDGTDEAIFDLVQPYVKDWDVTWVEGDDLYAVSPPAESNGDAFNFAPKGLALAIVNSLMSEPFRRVDPKSSTPVESTE